MNKLHHYLKEDTKIFAYIRTSTKKESITPQIELIEKYCKEHNLTIDEWFEDIGVDSKRTSIFKRKGFNTMHDKIHEFKSNSENKKVLIIVSHFNRLSEKKFSTFNNDFCPIVNILLACQIISLSQNLNLSDEYKQFLIELSALSKALVDENEENYIHSLCIKKLTDFQEILAR